MSFKKIVVPYDASEYSNRAFKYALEIAKKDHSKITVVKVIDGGYAANFAYTSKTDPDIIKKEIKTYEKFILKLKSSAKKVGVPFSSKILQNASIVKALVNFTKSGNVDLIVIGSHGRTGLSKLVLGSVANGVAHHAKCPVMIVK